MAYVQPFDGHCWRCYATCALQVFDAEHESVGFFCNRHAQKVIEELHKREERSRDRIK